MKKKIIIYAVLLTFLLCLVISSIYAITILGKKPKVTNNNKPNIPVITEDFDAVTANKLNKYNGRIAYDEKTKEIMEIVSFDEQYILGVEGKLYPNKIKYINNEESKDQILKFGRYEIRKSEDKNDDTLYYYYDKLNKTNSKSYNYIEPIYYKDTNTPRYLILSDNDVNIKLLDIKTNKIVVLNENIYTLPELINELYGYGEITNNEYEIVAMSNNDKYGIINSNGDILVDFIYDNILSYKNGLFIAQINGKYGIIDKNNKTILKFEYDTMSYAGNYIIVTKNDKLGVLNNKYKTLVNFTIKIDTSIEFYNIYGNNIHGMYSAISENNSLLLMIYPKGYTLNEGGLLVKRDESVGNISSYVISSKGIERSFKVASNIEPLYDENNDYEKINYYYSVSIDDNKVTITFYDTDYYEYYKYTTKKLINSEYSVGAYLSNNVCYVDIYYEVTGKYDTIYLDLTNSKELNEIDALYKYFDNGYGYTLKDGVLTVYKDKEELEKFDNINISLGKYLFSTLDNEIIEIQFHKEK